MRGLSREEFAKALGEACVSVWVDDISGFGTFPIEAMKCETPVIGKIPNLKPDWLMEDNGFWSFDPNQLIDILSAFLKNWLEDNIPADLYEKMAETVKIYNEADQKDRLLEIFTNYQKESLESLNESLDKLQVVEQTK